MTGYSRQSAASIFTSNDIEAAHFNNEFNALVTAFGTSGHAHDGTTGNGPKINLTTSVIGELPTANIADDAITTAKIVDGAITLAKHANLASMSVIGNVTGGAATPVAVSILDEDDFASNSATAIPTQQSSKAYMDALALSSALPGQTGNANKNITTDGTNASWAFTEAANVTFTPTGTIAATDVQAAIAELDTDIQGLSFTAASITNTPAGTIAATDVQAAINELDTDVQALNEGHLTLLSTTTVSGSPSTIDLDLTGSYVEYRIVIDGIGPATSSANLLLQYSNDGGSTFLNSTYRYHYHGIYDGSTTAVRGSSSDSSMEVGYYLSNSANYGSFWGALTIYDPHNTIVTQYTRHRGEFRGTGGHYGYECTSYGGGWHPSTTAIDAVRFSFSTGNFANQGKIRLYGVTR